jgi:hypothetical protein
MDTFGTWIKKVIRLADVELFTNYALVITNLVALFDWWYRSFHVIKPYRIGNGKNQTSHQCFGEELMVENTDQAIAKCKPTQMEVVDYTVALYLWKAKKRCPWMDDWI